MILMGTDILVMENYSTYIIFHIINLLGIKNDGWHEFNRNLTLITRRQNNNKS